MARASSRNVRPISSSAVRGGNPVTFIQESLSELRKSVWPSREETSRLTTVVIILSLVIGFFLGGLDRVLVETFSRYIL